ncbi:hypothetical protein IGI04_014702 [Brassica rapa subsp. trilocularis]|uniref:Uncharacterized protein n=1 Tax=Brassica rapa subsp. trilocularis TaxID=1813537 RepID=A0ABQ7MMZ9_BRACM|nr:hypothetical protein IGI04_014702 [Brassica rapa subsp. trilocularis]
MNMTWWQPPLNLDSWKPVQSWSMILQIGPGDLLIPHAKQSEHDISTTKYKNPKKRANLGSRAVGEIPIPSPCLSPRTPYILAPRSVYAFTLLPLSRHSIKWRYSIFSDFRVYPQNSVFIRGNLTFILPCAPSVYRATVYRLLVKKS